ncbi:hypothetical protein [Argonema galeatum]|nr:hypothetical protein [Argonema galeatum]
MPFVSYAIALTIYSECDRIFLSEIFKNNSGREILDCRDTAS